MYTGKRNVGSTHIKIGVTGGRKIISVCAVEDEETSGVRRSGRWAKRKSTCVSWMVCVV